MIKETDLFEQRRTAIKEIIYAEDYIPLKFKEMAFLLGVPADDREELRKVMNSLVEDGSIVLTARGKYIKPEHRNETGVFTANQRGFGFVKIDGKEEEIFIPADYVNGAFHQDHVRVKITKNAIADQRAEGMITKILERRLTEVVGTLSVSQKGFGFVLPDDPHVANDIYIPEGKRKNAQNKDKVVVKLVDYGNEKKNPTGVITEIIGNIEDPRTDVTSIVRALGIPEEFPKAAMQEARRIQQTINGSGHDRTDFRNLLTVTIDGEDARDLDDAITLYKEGDGYVLGVHIADVSHYVTEGSALDTEAMNRGTSVYLCDRVIPMLPRELSNGICSLNAGEDRLALSCIMEMDAEGTVTDHRICESVIRVDKRMSYTGVQAILEGKAHPENERADINDMCFQMAELASILKERRRKRGAIDFDFPEAKILVDEEGYPVDIHPYERNTATDIIEDFMLICNETVAQEYFWMELPFLYRVHETPDAEKIKKLAIFIKNFGKHMKTGSDSFHPKEIQKLLFSLEGTAEEALISRIALRSMKQARYNTLNLGHFGLSTQYYTHFTSPIRRYPDLMIHRIIKENLHGKLNSKRIEHFEEILPGVAAESSALERRAQNAEREVEKLKKVEYMWPHMGEKFSGVISGVTSFGFFVELENTIEGLVPMENLLDDYYIYRDGEYCLVGEESGNVFRLGQRIDVVLMNVDKLTRTIDFMPLDVYSCYIKPDFISDEAIEEIMKRY